MEVGSYPLLSQAPTHVDVELDCDNWYIDPEVTELCGWSRDARLAFGL